MKDGLVDMHACIVHAPFSVPFLRTRLGARTTITLCVFTKKKMPDRVGRYGTTKPGPQPSSVLLAEM